MNSSYELNATDSPRSPRSPASTRKSRSRKKQRRDRSVDKLSVQSDSRSSSLTRYSVRSVGAIFPKSWKDSFRRKRDSSIASQRRDSKSELSTEEWAPGVLKVFGNSVTPCAEYKSVLATQSSTSQELIKEALERYGISKRHSTNFVLCDVIGKFSDTVDNERNNHVDEPEWTEECVRVIGDYEKPLTLQLYWKPAEGYSRRFEIRKRCQMQKPEEDTITSGINANARRMLLAKMKPSNLSTDNLYYSHIQTEEEDTRAGIELPNKNNIDLLSNVTHCADADESVEEKKRNSKEPTGDFVPTDCPFLLTIKHFSGRDPLLHRINHDEVTVGNNNSSSVILLAPDIFARQCVFHRKHRNTKLDLPTVHLKPSGKGTVSVNAKPIRDEVKLESYDVVSIGEYYSFMFIDPVSSNQGPNSELASHSGDSSQKDRDVVHRRSSRKKQKNKNAVKINSSTNKTSAVGKTEVISKIQEQPNENVKESKEVAEWRTKRYNEYEADSTRLKISYDKEHIDTLLGTIINLEDSHPAMYKLMPSYLFCMCVEYSAVKFEQATTRQLLLKMANSIQKEVWEKAKLLEEKPSNLWDQALKVLNDIRPLVSWLANTLEILHFLQQNLRADFLLDPAGSRQPLLGAQEDVLVVLDEVVIYTFQQTVYYLTKTLYSLLPALLNYALVTKETTVNSNGMSPRMDDVVAIFQKTLEMFTEYHLHPQIASQLFCYLFYFINTTVFNNLMAKENGSKHFRWKTGVQLRSNMDALQDWAGVNGFREEAAMYMKKLDCIASLLATPKVQLIKMSWEQIRKEYKEINRTQLKYVLTNYHLGTNKRIPFDWNPPLLERLSSAEEESLTESFSNHPPLVLPGDGFILNLSPETMDDAFCVTLKEVIDLLADKCQKLNCNQNLNINNDNHYSNLNEDFNRQFNREKSFSTSTDSIECENHDISRKIEASSLSNGNVQIDGVNSSEKQPRSSVYDTLYSKRRSISSKVKYETEAKSMGIQLTRTELKDCESVSGSTTKTLTVTTKGHKSSKSTGVYMNLPCTGEYNGDSVDRWYDSDTPPLAMSTPQSKSPGPELHRQTPSGNTTKGRWSSNGEPDVLDVRDKSTLQSKKSNEPKGVQLEYSLETPPVTLPLSVSSNILSHNEYEINYGRDGLKTWTVTDRFNEEIPVKATSNPAWSLEGKKKNGITPQIALHQTTDTNNDISEASQIFHVELEKGARGLGLGLIDGLYTPLQKPGIFVRTLVPGEPAALDGNLKLGDKILAVNGESIVGSTYQSAMELIRNGGNKLQFHVAKSSSSTALKVAASTC